LNGEANSLNRKHSSAVIAVDVSRFYWQINTDEVLGTHSAQKYACLCCRRRAQESGSISPGTRISNRTGLLWQFFAEIPFIRM
jgi:hypothetical protein